MKKVIKKTASSRKPVEPPRGFIKPSIAKKPMMKSGGAKKTLTKYQSKGAVKTPFQEYMKNPGAVASDTLMKTVDPENVKLNGQPGVWYSAKKPVPKNPNNQSVLEKAFEKTYGQGWRSESGQPGIGETFEQYKRRMGPLQKKGGATKSTNKKNTTMKKLVKADKGIQIGKKKSTVSVTQDVDGKNVPFTGTVKENKRKAVMKVSNPDYGSTKTIEKFGRKGNLKSQTIFDRDASNKLSKVTRNKVDKEGNIQSSVPYQSQKKGGATKSTYKKGGMVKKATAKKTMVRSKKK